jgi:trans-2,3-dihydro-3-hydroxyanthranilate isomerase
VFYRFITLDVFTKVTFGGNPLAVVFDAIGLSPEAMQNIAREFNLSETAFVLPPENPEGTHRVRIFTPVAELLFAGHPTLGAAIAIARDEGQACDSYDYKFEEGIGLVPVSVSRNTDGNFRAELSVAQIPEQLPEDISTSQWADILGLENSTLCSNETETSQWSCGAPFSFVPVASLSALESAKANLTQWENHLSTSQVTGVFVFTQETNDNRVDLRARMFAPSHGIAEDPATGSAVAALAGWLVDAGKLEDGTHNWVIEQGVEMGRPSRLELEADVKNGRITSVQVGGHAVVVSHGEITVS